MESALPATDVLYITRIQKERFNSTAEYEKVKSIVLLSVTVIHYSLSTKYFSLGGI